MNNIRHISDSEVATVLKMEDLIPRVRKTMVDYSRGLIEQPARRILPVREHHGYFTGMSAVTPYGMGAKILSYYPKNCEQNLSTHMSLIVLFRPESGEPLALIEGRLITEMRTAAATAVFFDAVASQNVTTMAILGSGAQGEYHAATLAKIRNFDEIRIWNRTSGRANKLAEKIGGIATSCEKAVRNADIVVAATGSSEPIINGGWLSPKAKIASVGWSGKDGAELDSTTMSNIVVVDSREGTTTESGRYDSKIYAELGEILDGSLTIDPNRIVVFDSIGMACQDIATASLVLEKLSA